MVAPNNPISSTNTMPNPTDQLSQTSRAAEPPAPRLKTAPAHDVPVVNHHTSNTQHPTIGRRAPPRSTGGNEHDRRAHKLHPPATEDN
ncbi:hypothetical protein GCM10028799_83800 [Kribbella italica]